MMLKMNALNTLANVCVNERQKRKTKLFRVMLRLVSRVCTKQQYHILSKLLVAQAINPDPSGGKQIASKFRRIIGDKKWEWVVTNTRMYAKSF